jgi:hypothetical protein
LSEGLDLIVDKLPHFIPHGIGWSCHRTNLWRQFS